MENDWRVCTKLRPACWNINRFVTVLVSELVHAKLRRKQFSVDLEAPYCVKSCSECWAGMFLMPSKLSEMLICSWIATYSGNLLHLHKTTVVEHVLWLLHLTCEGYLAFKSVSFQPITDKWSTRMCHWCQDPWEKACKELLADLETWERETVEIMHVYLGIYSWCPAILTIWMVIYKQVLMT